MMRLRVPHVAPLSRIPRPCAEDDARPFYDMTNSVFYLLAKGRRTEYIQNKLVISSHTVKTHTYNIYKKLGVKNREELLDLVEESE